jgi:hypothetical protein
VIGYFTALLTKDVHEEWKKRAVVLDQLVKAVRKHGKGKRKEGVAKTQHGGASDAGAVGEGGGSSSSEDVSSSAGNEAGGGGANEVVVGIEQPPEILRSLLGVRYTKNKTGKAIAQCVHTMLKR